MVMMMLVFLVPMVLMMFMVLMPMLMFVAMALMLVVMVFVYHSFRLFPAAKVRRLTCNPVAIFAGNG